MLSAPRQDFGIALPAPRVLLVLIITASCTNYCFLQFLLMNGLTDTISNPHRQPAPCILCLKLFVIKGKKDREKKNK